MKYTDNAGRRFEATRCVDGDIAIRITWDEPRATSALLWIRRDDIPEFAKRMAALCAVSNPRGTFED